VHPLFDELRTEGVRMPNGREFPRLFDFTKEGENQARRIHTDVLMLFGRNVHQPGPQQTAGPRMVSVGAQGAGN
jgi:hypothetical protein